MAGWTANTIVVPVDFFQESENAIQHALRMANDPRQIYLLHVLMPLDTLAPPMVSWGEITEETRIGAVYEQFKLLQSRLNATDAKVEVRLGNPGHVIAEYAEELKADVIIISSHGYHGFKRMLLGSVAERVIREAHCPVLVLRRTDAD